MIVFAVLSSPLVVGWPGPVPAAGQETESLAVSADSLDDGPHVYWIDDSNARVFYICNGEFLPKGYRLSRNLTFAGLCADSLVEYDIPAREPSVERHEFSGVRRVLALSDIHGEYAELVAFLRAAGVVDQNARWRWGDGHLVIAGDVFDRGGQVTECLWLIHRLEREAREAGGRVHYLLGNHELMVLRRDDRYVNERYLRGIVQETTIWYDDLFGPDMELGRWLRTKHAAIKINDIVFVHGGLGPAIVERELDLEELNEAVRASIDLRSYEVLFSDEPSIVLGSEGPFWYRGYHLAMPGIYERITPQELETALDFYDAETVVVGHTDIGRIQRLYDGRVYGIDVSVDDLGGFEGLFWANGVFSRVTPDGSVEGF